ncbi:MAG: pyrroloquinoline quinone biosynthesis protein PqqB [Planctomycetota bacterium]|nr:pyrroloquinoline quinone biosynthesis protein PqqB [Planctomycetota bacterium]
MIVQILGSGAGGGVPQWNCHCVNCAAARQPDGRVIPRTQSSAAISADGDHWFLLNVSADVRAQINASENLWPPEDQHRGTAIAGCLLTDAEIDHTSGLLQLREGCRFPIYSTSLVRQWLELDLPLSRILQHFAPRDWTILDPQAPTELKLPNGRASGLEVGLLNVGEDIPRYVQHHAASPQGSIVALAIRDQMHGHMVVYAPGVASLTPSLVNAAAQADIILIDGTFWSDDEPRRTGIRDTTACQMGHLPVSGPTGTLDWLADQPAAHRVYVHINNTNPMLIEDGPERQQVNARGIRVAQDGDLFSLLPADNNKPQESTT